MGTSLVVGSVIGGATATAIATCLDDVPQAGSVLGCAFGFPVGILAGEIVHDAEAMKAWNEGGYESWKEHQWQ